MGDSPDKKAYYRFDRLATLYFFRPLLKGIRSRNETRIPILMYHSISSQDDKRIHPYFQTNTTPNVFESHMKFLYENRYTVIKIDDVVRFLSGEGKVKDKYVSITFDDGFRDVYTQAFPILQKYNYTATMFLPTGFIHHDRMKFQERECLIWDEVRQLHRHGIAIGSHTVTHPELKSLKRDEIKDEIKGSKEIIEDMLGEPIQSFSFPYAFPDEDKVFINFLRDTLKSYSYKNGVNTRIGTATKRDDIFFMKRIPLNVFDDPFFLSAKLQGAYDWLLYPQLLNKKLKTKVLG